MHQVVPFRLSIFNVSLNHHTTSTRPSKPPQDRDEGEGRQLEVTKPMKHARDLFIYFRGPRGIGLVFSLSFFFYSERESNQGLGYPLSLPCKKENLSGVLPVIQASASPLLCPEGGVVITRPLKPPACPANFVQSEVTQLKGV